MPVRHETRGRLRLTPQDLVGWRGRMRLSQAALARELDVDPSTVKRWEHRQTSIPPFLHLALDSLQLELT